ncbi:MAG TPA: DUF4340 domain-containing protein [Spirochaetota bacterium]|nr:DUF4340 domain-containing protein [Spirochaetota bacterium]
MKNKTFISIGLILVLSAALVIKNYGCGSKVPELEGWYEPADEIDIKGKDVSLYMVKKENSWFINEQAYPGDAELIENLERKARDFKLLDLVSEKGYYNKYDLTEETGILVIIKVKGKVLRKILIGKAGSTNNHSYLKVDDRNEIYLASGIMKSDFSISAADLRDKRIIDVKSTDVKSFSINYGGKIFNFELSPSKNESEKNNEKRTSGSEWICREYGKVNLNDSAVNSILALFSPLRAAEFPEKAEKKNAGNTICKVNILYADKKIELEIYSKKDHEMNLASSSESKYIFTLGKWQTEKLFINSITDLAVK